MDAKIFRINYKSDFILTLTSDAGWMTPFCIKFWTGAPAQAYYAQWDGETHTHCSFDPSAPTKLTVQFDDHHLPIGDLKFQIAYHFTVADFPNDTEDEVLNQANITTEIDGEEYQVMLDFKGETAPEIQFSLPAYANEAQRIANEEQRIQDEETRIVNEEQRIANEEQRIQQETARANEFARLKRESEQATSDANTAADLANEKAQMAADKAALAQAAATLAGDKAQLADDKAALAQAAATLANDKAALAQQKADYAQTQGDYAKAQGDYAKAQGDTAQADHERAEADHTTAAYDHQTAVADHTTAASDHSRAEGDHTTAASDHTRAEGDHTTASSDHTRAESDHTTAASDHNRAESDHTTAAADHNRAESDHTTAAADHTRAESDHAAVEVYVDSLGVFDLSKHNAVGGVLATYADLDAALNALNALDSKYKYGGMSFKFVLTYDNKYVQYMCKSSIWSTVSTDWEKINNVTVSQNTETAGYELGIGTKKYDVVSDEQLYGINYSKSTQITSIINIQLLNKQFIAKVGETIKIQVTGIGTVIADYRVLINGVYQDTYTTDSEFVVASANPTIEVKSSNSPVIAAGTVIVTVTKDGFSQKTNNRLNGIDTSIESLEAKDTLQDGQIKDNDQSIGKVTVATGSATLSASGSGNINVIPQTNVKFSSKITKALLYIDGFNEYYTDAYYYFNGYGNRINGDVSIPILIDISNVATFKVVVIRSSVTQSGEGKLVTATLKVKGLYEDLQDITDDITNIESDLNTTKGNVTSISYEITKIEGGTLKTYPSPALSQAVNNWIVGASATKVAVNLGEGVDYAYLNMTGFGVDYTEFFVYERHFNNVKIVAGRDTLPLKLQTTNGVLYDFGIVILKGAVTNDGVGKVVNATLSVKPIYDKDKPSCEGLIVQPSPFYTLPIVSGFPNFIPRVFIEGLLKSAQPKLRIDGSVTAPVTKGNDPVISTAQGWSNSANDTSLIPFVISHEDYADYGLEITRHRTSPYKLVGKTLLHMNIGSSNTDGNEHGETALEDFLCTELSEIWDNVKTDSSSINVKFVGTKCENTTFTFNDKSFSTTKSCNEGRAAMAIADMLRHIFIVRGFGVPDSRLNAYWSSLGLRTKTRNGVAGRDEPVEYSYSASDHSKAFEMRDTCHGYYDADPCEDLWNFIADDYYMRGQSFEYDGVTYTFGQSYTGSQADDDAQKAWIKYVCTTGRYRPTGGSNFDIYNPFYDYATVQSTDGAYAFSLGAYLANYRTMDDSGIRLSADSPNKGLRVTDVNAYDVCKPTSVKIEMGGNDYNLGVDAVRTANDNKLMADLIHAYDSNIKIGIQEYRQYGALNPSFYSLAGLSVRKGGVDNYRSLYHQAVTALFENGSMENYYHLSNYASQTVLGQTVKAFDSLDDNEIRTDFGDDNLHSTMFAYFDKAYQVVAWLCYINR